MKLFSKFIAVTSFAILLNSCSLTLGGLVAIDNSIYVGPKEIEFEKLQMLEEGDKVIITLNDSTKIAGSFISIKNLSNENKNISAIVLHDDYDQQQLIQVNEINKCTYIDEGSSICTAIVVGAAIDAIMIFLIADFDHGIGFKVF